MAGGHREGDAPAHFRTTESRWKSGNRCSRAEKALARACGEETAKERRSRPWQNRQDAELKSAGSMKTRTLDGASPHLGTEHQEVRVYSSGGSRQFLEKSSVPRRRALMCWRWGGNAGRESSAVVTDRPLINQDMPARQQAFQFFVLHHEWAAEGYHTMRKASKVTVGQRNKMA